MRAIPTGWVPAGHIARADGRIVRLVDPPEACDCPPTIPLPVPLTVGRTRHGRHCAGCSRCRQSTFTARYRAALARLTIQGEPT